MEKNLEHGLVSIEKIINLIDDKILFSCSDEEIFSIFILDFEIFKYYLPSQMSNIDLFSLSNSIGDIIGRENNYYSVDESGKFILFFENNSTNINIQSIIKIIEYFKQNPGDYIKSCNIGIAEFPMDGKDAALLIKAAENYILNDEEKMLENINTSELSLRILRKKLSKINEHSDTKAQLIKQLSGLINDICDYDDYLRQHTALVTAVSILLAKELELHWEEIEKIAIASILHDIGYTTIPKSVFLRPGRLTGEDWQVIKLHPVIACEKILRPMKVFEEYIPIIMNHHELIDGSGYPKGKKGEQFPIGSQIISIIDAYQSMRVDRPYRKAYEVEDIVEIFTRNAGIKWDKKIVIAFTAIIADPIIRKELVKDQGFYTEISPF